MDKSQKQNIINEVTNNLKTRSWFYGAGFEGDKLIIGYNFYPAFELKQVKEALVKYGIEHELRDRQNIPGGQRADDTPSYMK
jgi:hypothetical protein